MYIYNDIAQRGLRAGPAWDSRRAWPIDMAHRASLNGRLGRQSHPESPRIARFAQTRRFERQTSTDKGAREVPRCDFRRFQVDFGIDFRCFSRQHCASDMTRGASGRTLDFADRRGTLETSQTLRKARKSTKIEGKSLRRRFANERAGKNRVLGSRVRLGVHFGGSEAFRAFPGAPPGVPGRSWGPFGRSRGVPGAPQDASETLPGGLPNALGHHGASREGRGIDFESILDASGQLRAALGIDLGSIFKRLAQKNRLAYRYGID